MDFKIGDTVFLRDGSPALVKSTPSKISDFKVQKTGEELEQRLERGLINGLDSKERENYNSLIDETRHMGDLRERIDFLSAKISEYSKDPKKIKLTRYLKGEMAHLSARSHYHPSELEVSELHVK